MRSSGVVVADDEVVRPDSQRAFAKPSLTVGEDTLIHGKILRTRALGKTTDGRIVGARPATRVRNGRAYHWPGYQMCFPTEFHPVHNYRFVIAGWV